MARTLAHERLAAEKAAAVEALRELVARVPAQVLRGGAEQAVDWRTLAERAHRMTTLEPKRLPPMAELNYTIAALRSYKR